MSHPDLPPDSATTSDGCGQHGRGHHRGRPRRIFDYGELRLLILAMIAEAPRHGYELIKAIEERMAGRYAPSPGVIYPTLSWLDDMGYAAIDADQPGRKRYRITTEGEAFLHANHKAAEAVLARKAPDDAFPPMAVAAAMDALKAALRARFGAGAVSETEARTIAEAITAAAHTISPPAP